MVRVPRVLERDAPGAAQRERADHEVDALHHAPADDDPLGVRHGAADAAQVAGEHLAQRHGPARIPVVELGGAHGPARLAHRPRPIVAREAHNVRRPEAEVDRGRRPALARRARRRLRLGAPGHTGRRPGPAGQVALRLELGVALEHQAA